MLKMIIIAGLVAIAAPTAAWAFCPPFFVTGDQMR